MRQPSSRTQDNKRGEISSISGQEPERQMGQGVPFSRSFHRVGPCNAQSLTSSQPPELFSKHIHYSPRPMESNLWSFVSIWAEKGLEAGRAGRLVSWGWEEVSHLPATWLHISFPSQTGSSLNARSPSASRVPRPRAEAYIRVLPGSLGKAHKPVTYESTLNLAVNPIISSPCTASRGHRSPSSSIRPARPDQAGAA